jgi:hypothetical protein
VILQSLNDENAETSNQLAEDQAVRQVASSKQSYIQTLGFDPFEPSEGVAQDRVVGQKAEADVSPTKEDPLKAFRSVITENPVTQIAGGIKDAISSTLNIPTDIFNLFTDIEKNGIGDMIPDIDKSDSVGLGVVRSAAQFMTDFVPAFKALKGVKTLAKVAKKAPKIAGAIRGEVAGAIAGAAAFDPDDPNLSNMINQMVPALRNPVTEFLATDPNDEAAFNRLKTALEGLGLGAITEGFLGTIRGVRAAKGLTRLKDELKGDIEKKVKAATKKGEIESVEEVAETIEDIPAADFSKAETPEQFNKAVADARELARRRLKAKRGKRPIPTSQQAADLLGLTKDDLKAIQEGTAFNAEQLIAAGDVVASLLDELTPVAEKIAKGTATSADKVSFLQMTQDIGIVDPKLFGVRGESGRALQALSQVKPTIKRLEAVTAGLASKEGGEVTIERFAGMYLTLMKETKPKEVAKWLRIIRRVPGMITEMFLSGLLSGIKTHEINFLGNTSTLFMAPVERGVAARLPNSTVMKGEATYMLFGMANAFSEAVRLAGRTLKTGIAQDAGIRSSTKLEGYSTRKITAEAFELANDSLAGRAVNGFGAVVTAPLRALLASDVFFKVINKRAELYALAIRDATEKNLTGTEAGKFIKDFIEDPDMKFIKKSEDFAAYETFTNDLGKFGTAVQNFANAHMAAKFFMPFVRTPINIFKFSYERTPIGGIHASLKQAIKGTDPVARDLALARLAMGSAAAGTFAMMAASGSITGSGPKNKEMRKIMKENGWQPNSFKVGDSYVNYNRADPVGQMIGDVADFVEASQYLNYSNSEGTLAQIEAVALGIVMAYSKNMLSKTYVTGMQNAMDIVQVGISTGELGKSFAQARSGLRKFSLAFIPTMAKDIAKAYDPVLREADTFAKAWKANTAYYSKEGFAERNIFGEQVIRGHMTAANNTADNLRLMAAVKGIATFINPLYITHDKKDVIMQEIIEHDATISQQPNWIAGSRPTFSFEKNKVGEGIRLTEEQQDFWKIETGRGLKDDLLREIDSSEYQSLPDFDKQQLLKAIQTEHRQDAREEMVREFELRGLIEEKEEELEQFREETFN